MTTEADFPDPAESPDPCAGFDAPGDCADAAAELYGYLDGVLTDERRAKIAGHLDGCSGCFGAYEFHAELKTVISMKCQTEVPEALRRRIIASLSELTDLPDPS